MSALLAKIFQQAVITFRPTNNLELPRNLETLKSLVDKIRYADLELDPRFITKSFFAQPEKAPCTFVRVYEDSLISMSVFIMAENYTMPMHDHPQMHGILKCIAGNLRIQSYSMDNAKEEPLNVLERLYTLNPTERPPAPKYVHCRREPAIDVDETSPAASLTPGLRNIHQISALGGPVAFFDILSPPYNTLIDDRPHLNRKCTFFRVAEESPDSDQVLLEKIPQPLSYYCD